MGFIGNVSPEWLEKQYYRWRKSPEWVGAELHAFFSGFDLGMEPALSQAAMDVPPAAALKESAVQSLIYRYRDIGHLLACTDPLSPCSTAHPLLDLSAFDLDERDLDTIFHTRRFMKQAASLREIRAVMRETYCRSIGVEFMYLQVPAERQWLIDRMEPIRNQPSMSMEEKLAVLGTIQEAVLFEEFLHRKFIGQTRFSLEGGEILIPTLAAAVSHAGEIGVTDIIIGMPHRGRLNVLANILRQPLQLIFAMFRDNIDDHIIGDGDVKYHAGASTDVELPGEKRVHLTLAANPSHLEAIDPVVVGKARARQDRRGADGAKAVLPLLIHGDAAFAGQGVVAETFNLSQLEGYKTGGTLHIVLNNQIGFTTPPVSARSSCYATDLAKIVMAPIFHVHGEDPEAAVHVVRLALDYRREFARDVVVELICYRRYGHNEGDEPYFTQPLMYQKIRSRPRLTDLYTKSLLDQGADKGRISKMEEEMVTRLEQASGEQAVIAGDGYHGAWSGVSREYTPGKVVTGVERSLLQELAVQLAQQPEDLAVHPKVAALQQKRREAVEKGDGIDWANAEMLAFATLLKEGKSVRLSGQDVSRGTFSQRHAVIYDSRTGKGFIPLNQVGSAEARFRVFDSMLSEYAVMGFEYGYSIESPHDLVIWEAQYGDFANAAQVVIDQFVVSSETKWDRTSGLVLLLPHGYEGQGAEHSSGRIERFLQMCAGNNILLAYPSKPAQYFHLLRRQVLQTFRKPLVVFTPKSLLRHPRCVSPADEFSAGWFREVIASGDDHEKVRAVLLCSGKIYYELLERKEKEKRDDVAIVTIEQLYPLRTDLLHDTLGRYRKAVFTWVQEEPYNMGAWGFIRPHLAALLGKEPRYVGRGEHSAPAVGSSRLHRQEQEKIVEEAFAMQ